MSAKTSRKLYKIGHLTKLLGVTPRTIRYYDQFGLLPHVKRSEGNVRLFDEEDVDILKRIRYFQKEEYLPLEVIRERLFGQSEKQKKYGKKDCAIVTDSLVSITSDQKDKMHVEFVSSNMVYPKQSKKEDAQKEVGIPEITPFTQKSFEDKYRQLHKKGIKTIYSVHSASQFSNAYEVASKAALKVSDTIQVTVVSTQAIGAGVGLFISQLSDVLIAGGSQEKLDLFISKTTSLIFTLYAVEGIHSYLNHTDKNQVHNNLTEKLSSIKSLLRQDGKKEGLDILNVFLEQERMTEVLIETLEEEFINRGRYINAVMLSYHHLYAEAMELANTIKSLFPNTMVYVEKDDRHLPAVIGEQSISVSIV